MNKLFVGVCNSQEKVPSDFFWSMVNQKPCVAKVLLDRERHPWDVIRNNLLIKRFLDSGCDYFAKTDIDQVYPFDYFQVMVPLIDQYKVIGPLIFDRWVNGNFMPLVNWDREKPLKHYNTQDRFGIERVDILHTNCFYHREVLEQIPEPWYEAYAAPDGLSRANHVDLTFIQKIKDAGYDLYVNYDVVVQHIAEVPVGRDVYERWNR